MSDKLTSIWLPGGPYALNGLSEWGDQDAPTMIAALRRYATSMRDAAEVVLAAADDDFRIEQGRGVHRRRDTKIIQEGRTLHPRAREAAPKSRKAA